MRRVAAFVLTAALHLQSVVPAFASSGGADALVCRGNASRLSRMDYHNGTYALYTYDERSRVAKIEHKNSSHSLIAKEENTYDPASNITQRITGGVTTDYEYDEINQLIDEGSWLAKLTGYTMTFGNYVVIPGKEVDSVVLAHELVHRDQSGKLGFLYLQSTLWGYVMGAGRSLLYKHKLSVNDLHDASPLEMDADARSRNYSNIDGNWAVRKFWLGR